VALVISGGDPASILDGSIGWGDLLVLGGVLSFVLYTLGAARFTDLSPLRYTARTAALGWISIAGATVGATALGLQSVPSADAVRDVGPQPVSVAKPRRSRPWPRPPEPDYGRIRWTSPNSCQRYPRSCAAR
jgi:hypothetical protein